MGFCSSSEDFCKGLVKREDTLMPGRIQFLKEMARLNGQVIQYNHAWFQDAINERIYLLFLRIDGLAIL